MSVMQVWALVDGVEMSLELAGGDVWTVPVPRDSDGEYAVEIWAEDEAGNTAHIARMLYIVKAGSVCVHMLPLKYRSELTGENRYYGELLREETCNEACYKYGCRGDPPYST